MKKGISYLDIENVQFNLSLTLSLIVTVYDSFLKARDDEICNNEVFWALRNLPEASNLCHNFKFLVDDFDIIEDRIRDAIKMLDKIVDNHLKSCKAEIAE